MAELFLARTVGAGGFEKVVALKKILPKYTTRQKYISLFCDEARLAASLNHTNIVQVYDIGIDGGNYFFAMEYLHGQDIRTVLHRAWAEGEKMPLRFAVQIATQVAAALHYAHNMKRPDGSDVDIVHRDVSPSNIIVTYDGAVKLLDFGVAKAATRTVKTRTGTLKGKISYMSPEQAKGAPVDRRSDIFSLGIVLWEMVTTSRLYRGENDLATLQLIVNTPPKKPSEARPDCPPELERIVLKALSQDISQRYQTADELLRDLEAFAAAEDLGPSPTALSVYISELFANEITQWNEAKAAGVPLGEHLTHIGDMTEPVLESEFIEAMDLPAMLAREEAADALGESGDDEDDDHDDEEDDDEPSTMIPAPAKAAPPAAKPVEEKGRFDTPSPRQSTPTPARPPPLPPKVPPRRDPTPAVVRKEGTPAPQFMRPPQPTPGTGTLTTADTITTQKPPLSGTMTAAMGDQQQALHDAPTLAHPPIEPHQMPPVAAGSNPFSVVKTPSGSSPEAMAQYTPSPSSSLTRMKAWVSGSFPARDLDRRTVALWERRALLIGGILLGLIFVIAIILAISG